MALFGDLGDRRELEKKAKAEGRLPPGQSLTLKWPVLHYGSIPHFDAAKWDFKISGEVEESKRLTLEGISRTAADGDDFGFSLRDALEPAGQSLERCFVHGCHETGQGESRSAVCLGAR